MRTFKEQQFNFHHYHTMRLVSLFSNLLMVLALSFVQHASAISKQPNTVIAKQPNTVIAKQPNTVPVEKKGKGAVSSPPQSTTSQPQLTKAEPPSSATTEKAEASAVDTKPTSSTWSPWIDSSNLRSRVSLGLEFGAGSNTTVASNQGYIETYLSSAFDLYDRCSPDSNTVCFRFHLALPILGVGYYPTSKIPFFQAALGPGIQAIFGGFVGIMLQGGVGIKSSSISSLNEQDARDENQNPIPGKDPIPALAQRMPTDKNMVIGWVQAGMFFDLGKALATPSSRGFSIHVSVKVQNAPSLPSNGQSVDTSVLVGARFRLPK